jgi:kinesin family protein 18/19
MIYLTMADLFQRIDDRRDEWDVAVIVTFLEIYNEEIRDLLSDADTPTPRGGLQIREDKSVKVVGLVELRPKSAEEVKEIVLLGNTRRTQSPTHANATSSRSHAVLQVHVTQSPRTADVTEQRTMGTLSIIDLAGSERAAATSNMGQRMVEGANINKSLLALGNCINALCESGGAIRHVPYRNSKLTRLLKFSLGGNCKTVMVVCIAPTSLHFEDTHNTLLYAERATKIKTKVITRNVVNVDRHVGRYVEAINRLNLEVAELKAKLAGKASGEAEGARRKTTEANLEVERAKKDLQAKVVQIQPSIVDGASCEGKLEAAKIKLASVRRRLDELDIQSASAPLSSDLQAESILLQALAAPEESALRPDSLLNARLQRSINSSNMFDATLKVVSERRSDRLDETSMENVRLETRTLKAEMEKARADARDTASRDVLQAQTQFLVNLVGMVGRCNIILGEASRMLLASASPQDVAQLAATLSRVAEQNDTAFTNLIGASVANYSSSLGPAPSALTHFKSYGGATSRAPAVAAAAPTAKIKPARRASVLAASPRRAFRSPRKPLRNSLGGTNVPYRHTSAEDKSKRKKSVQWRDNAGRGELDDGGNDPFNLPTPTPSDSEAGPSNSSSSNAIASSSSQPIRPGSVTGSESDWEDERSETGVRSYAAGPRSSISNLRDAGNGATKIRRPSRLDPSFLKGKGPTITLSSLTEEDQEELTPRRPTLRDLSMNRREEPSSPTLGPLHVPKAKDRMANGSPHKRMPTGSVIKTHSRRRSNTGPIRVERSSRRRSSLQHDEDDRLGPASSLPRVAGAGRLNANGSTTLPGPRRILVDHVVKSPAKRAKRVSLLGAAAARSLKARQVMQGNNSFLALPVGMDPNSSADISTSSARPGSSKAIWR